MRKLLNNNNASAWAVIIFIICLAAASITILIVGEVFEPFMNLMDGNDPDVESADVPRGYVSLFFQLVFPKGLLVVVFIGLSVSLIMEYQKTKYKEV